jgi:putative solute:sodium symporter small subunit
MSSNSAQLYWRENIKLVLFCLSIWFVVSYLFGIILVEPLNEIRMGGYKLGFWFAQQGSIYTFVALVFFYSWRMNRLDRKYGVDKQDEK